MPCSHAQGALVGYIGWACRGDCATISCDKPHQTPRPGPSLVLLFCSPWCSWGHPFLAPRSHAPALCPQPDASRLLDENKKSLPSSSPGARWSLQENQLRKVAVVSLISQSAQARGVSSSMSHPKQEGSSMGDMGPLSRELPAPSPGAS